MNEVKVSYEQNQGLWNVKVSADEQKDVREAVFYKMAELNCPIFEMKSRKVSLEEIFLELTENEKTDNETKEEIMDSNLKNSEVVPADDSEGGENS